MNRTFADKINQVPPVIVRILLILALAGFLGGIYRSASAKDVPMADIESAMVEKTDINKMEKCNQRKLLQFMGLNAESYDSWMYYKSKESLGVDEILVIKVKDTGALSGLQDAAEKRVESQKKAFDGYGTNQMKLLGNAVIETKGKYFFYCVSENPIKYEEVFRNVIQ